MNAARLAEQPASNTRRSTVGRARYARLGNRSSPQPENPLRTEPPRPVWAPPAPVATAAKALASDAPPLYTHFRRASRGFARDQSP
jgi:hypothetical protein